MLDFHVLQDACLRSVAKALVSKKLMFVSALGLGILSSCATSEDAAQGTSAPKNTPARGWQTSLRADSPLVGGIWEVSSGRFISAESLLTKLKMTEYVLLGEKHDNPDHHTLQRELIAALADNGALGAVSFEMLATDMMPRLATLATRRFASSERLAEYIEWDRQGWDWSLYGPLVSAAYERGVPIYAGNISRSEMSALYASDASVVDGAVGELGQAKLREDIDSSHCGMLPESQFDAMVRVQQGRDESLAKSLADAQRDYGKRTVLIAGNYHIRQDIGVPNYLLRAHAGLARDAIAAVAFLEVVDEESHPERYLDDSVELQAYDYVWFTPALSDKDYCAGMRGES
jgi:uncharacterized iron-regulated protein